MYEYFHAISFSLQVAGARRGHQLNITCGAHFELAFHLRWSLYKHHFVLCPADVVIGSNQMEYECDADAILLRYSLIAAHLAVKTTSETRATTKSCVVISCWHVISGRSTQRGGSSHMSQLLSHRQSYIWSGKEQKKNFCQKENDRVLKRNIIETDSDDGIHGWTVYLVSTPCFYKTESLLILTINLIIELCQTHHFTSLNNITLC